MGFMRNQYYKAKDEKFKALFSVKPDLNPVIHCQYHQCEGCEGCDYVVRCGIKTGGDLICL